MVMKRYKFGSAGEAGLVRAGLVLLLVSAAGASALAQADSPAAPSPLIGPLTGPSVDATKAKRSLVERDYEGKVRRLEIPAEEAAIGLLGLSEMDRAKADEVIRERAATLDKVVIENVDLLLEMQTARASGDMAKVRDVIQRFTAKLEGLRSRGKPVDEIASALPEANREEYRRLVKEYHRAVYDELAQEAKSRGERWRPREIIARQVAQAVGAEVKRSYERQIGSRTQEFEQVLARLDLSPEQEAEIRRMVNQWAQEVKLNPTPTQRREIVEKVLSKLTPTQRRAALREFLAERAGR